MAAMAPTPCTGRFASLNRRRILQVLAVGVWALALADVASAEPATVRHAGRTIAVKDTLADPQDLWVHPDDLTRINGFVLKPEGACLDDVCIPIRQDRDSELLVTRSGVQWINLSAFARKINQRMTVDHDRRVWTFGPLPFKRSGTPSGAAKKGLQ